MSQYLNQNQHFRGVKGAGKVYGNAFIFKVKKPASQSEDRVLEYENLDKSFIDSAFKGKGILCGRKPEVVVQAVVRVEMTDEEVGSRPAKMQLHG